MGTGQPPPSARRSSVLVPLLTLLAGCGRQSGPTAELVYADLLIRRPDAIIEERVQVVPDAHRQWGRLGRSGWGRRTQRTGEGAPFVWSHDPVAVLLLPAVGPGPRTLEIEAWVAEDPAHPGVGMPGRIRLNDIELDEIELQTAPRTFRVETPEILWKRGDNVLSIEVGSLRRNRQNDVASLALARVGYGEEHSAEYDEQYRSLNLRRDTTVRYCVELAGPTVLDLWGETRERGRLELAVHYIDPETEAVVESLPTITVQPEDGELTAAIPLASPGSHVAAIDISWESSLDDGGANLHRLVLLTPEAGRPPSIVLISIDTLAARHTSVYGYPRQTTPSLERFAAESVVFERCSANAPWTSPSYMALMTGIYASTFRMDFGGGQGSPYVHRLPESRWTLAESLRARGYRTAGFVDNLLLDERFGFRQGFDLYDTSAAEVAQGDPAGGIRHIVPRALEWLDSLGEDEPFFLFLHAYDVHGPYTPEEPWRGRFRSDELAARSRPVLAGALTHTIGQIPEYIARGEVPTGDIPKELPSGPIVSAYDEGILALDHELGGFFGALRERGIPDEAIVVFTADHGEATADHDYFGHGMLYEEVLHVPLIVRLPGGRGGGRREARSVQLVDLHPTLTDLAGIDGERGHLHGRSIVPLLRGERMPAAPTFGEGGIMRQASLELSGWKLIEMHPGEESLPSTMLSHPLLSPEWVAENAAEVAGEPITAERMYALGARHGKPLEFYESLRAQFSGPVYALYHLPDDPLEQHDLSAERPAKLQELLAELRKAQELRSRARAGTTETRVVLTPEDIEELRKLGYIDGE